MTKKEVLQSAALNNLDKGLNTIAVDGHKKAIFSWKEFTEDKITEKALIDQLNNPRAEGIAVICGGISGNLEVIDFDLKNDISGDLMERYAALIDEDLLKRLFIVRTRSGGYHIYYRSEIVEGNKKLASRPATKEELKDTPHLKQVVLIETRGNGGYVVAPPSVGYEIDQPNEIPFITSAQRDHLLDAARSFMEVYQEEKARFVQGATPFVISPFDDYNNKADAVGLLLRHGWTIDEEKGDRIHLKRPGNSTAQNSGNYHIEKRLFYVWTTSTQFEPGKAYSPAAIYAILEHEGDFSEASKALIKEGYGTRRTPESIAKAIGNPLEIDFKFWEVIPGKTDKHPPRIIVNLTKLVTFLHKKGGFSGFKYNDTSEHIIVQEQDGFLSEVEIIDIKQFLQDYIMNLDDSFDSITPPELMEVVFREYLKYLNTGFLDFLPVKKYDFLRDTQTQAFFPFRNGIVEVNKDGCKLHKYGTLNKVIWKRQMINFDIDCLNNPSNDLDFNNIDFFNFLHKVTGEEANETLPRLQYFITVAGYLLHKYKDPRASFAVILAEEAENEADGGGTGKGIFIKAIQQLIPTQVFDGKKFSAAGEFAFQRVTLDTKLIAIEDAKRSFRFEELYSVITEGVSVNKKNQKEFYIPFEDSPKLTISTNYVISDEGNHAKRRQKVLEFSNFFSPARTPFDVFNKTLFSDWDPEEWNRFYNFMFFACHTYLVNGIISVPQTDSNKIKNIKLKYQEDLYLFFQTYVDREEDFVIFKEVYNEFLKSYEMTSKDYTKEKFSRGMAYIASVLGYKYDSVVKKVDGKSQQTIRISKQNSVTIKAA